MDEHLDTWTSVLCVGVCQWVCAGCNKSHYTHGFATPYYTLIKDGDTLTFCSQACYLWVAWDDAQAMIPLP